MSQNSLQSHQGAAGEAVHREESHWRPSACLLGYYRKSFIACWQTGGTLLQSHLGGWQGKLWLWKSHPCITGVWSCRRHWRSLVLGKSCCRSLVLEELPCRSLVRGTPTWREIHFPSSVPLVTELNIVPAVKGEPFTRLWSIITQRAVKSGFGAQGQCTDHWHSTIFPGYSCFLSHSWSFTLFYKL